MPWTASTGGTLPSLKNKSIEVRKIFADVANESLSEGRTEDEAITAGLSAVASHERKKSSNIKKSIVAEREKANNVPLHLQILKIAKEQKIKEQEELAEKQLQEFKDKVQKFTSQTPVIKEMFFDKDGKLVVKYSDGQTVKSKNAIPDEVINQYISVAIQEGGTSAPVVKTALVPVTVMKETGPEIVFDNEGNVVMHEVTWE